jgi:3' exoribonuclease, RNase T-like
MNHLMIDIETLDTRPSAVVFQVAFVVFADPQAGKQLEILDAGIFHLDILEQILAGRTIDPETVKFWQAQDEGSWRRQPKDIGKTLFLFELIAKIMGDRGIGWVWSNSPSFDAVILRSLREDLNIPWEFPSFRTDMDMRTLKQLLSSLGKMKEAPSFETTHQALQDCHDQVKLVHYMLLQLGAK